MIPTRKRAKLPQGFSYPLGAELISAALQKHPQLEDMSLRFAWRDTFWGSEYQLRLKSQGKIRVLEVRYWHEWEIIVNAVPSEHNRFAREQLLEVLPDLSAWLKKYQDEARYASWSAHYDLAQKIVQVARL